MIIEVVPKPNCLQFISGDKKPISLGYVITASLVRMHTKVSNTSEVLISSYLEGRVADLLVERRSSE